SSTWAWPSSWAQCSWIRCCRAGVLPTCHRHLTPRANWWTDSAGQLDPVAAAELGPVQRRIRARQRLAGQLARLPLGHADADGDAAAIVHRRHRIAYRVAMLARLLQPGRRQQQGELLAAVARRQAHVLHLFRED